MFIYTSSSHGSGCRIESVATLQRRRQAGTLRDRPGHARFHLFYDDIEPRAAIGLLLLLDTGLHPTRSEEHTSELQSLMRLSYAVFCLKKKKITHNNKEAKQSNKTQ